jgi:hypothetical protein
MMKFSDENKLSRKTIALCIGACFVLVTAASLLIPVISGSGPAQAVVYYERLFPFYYQTNPDALLEMHSSLGFPLIFRTVPVRVNRPVVVGFVAALRKWVVMPVLSVFVPKRAQRIMWGDYSALSVLATYCTWVLLNAVLTLAAVVLLFMTWRGIVGDKTALTASMLVLTTPIVVLGIREIELGAFELFVIMASIWFWKAVFLDGLSTARLLVCSLGFGVLFLGKPAFSTFFVGWLLALISGKWKQSLAAVVCIAVPTIAWLIALRKMGIPYQVTEVRDFGAGVWVLNSASLIPDAISFGRQWIKIVFETSGTVSIPFFLVGVVSSRRMTIARIPLVRIAIACAAFDFVFYFLVHRAHAVYGLHTMVFYLVFTGVGMRWFAMNASGRFNAPWKFSEGVWIVACIAAAQSALLISVLPRYGG